jgi:8-oxo-dGTP pyrophosphatase MutT (NUDIX family)
MRSESDDDANPFTMRQQQPHTRNPEQVAVIAFRRGSEDVQICLIRRKDSKAWGIPKGFIDPGDSAEQAALNEAGEEAGIGGRLLGDSIGTYDYQKRGASFTVAVYLMEVLKEQPAWLEMRFRERKWWSLAEAASLLASHPVRPLLDRVRQRAEGQGL